MNFRLPSLFSVTDARSTRRLRFQTGIAFALAASVCGYLIDRAETQRINEQRARATSILERHLRTLDQSIHQALSATYAIAALVKQGKGTVTDFENTAREMISLYPGVGALQLAPDGVIRISVPLAGNEKAIGHDLLKDPARTKEAFMARDTGKLTLAGPFKLVQGGLGAVGRLPIFLISSTGRPEFWGFAGALIRFPDVLDAAGLGQLHESGYHYALWRLNPDSSERQIIAQSSQNLLKQPVSEQVAVPNGTWTLSAEPIGGWGDPAARWFSIAVGGLISVLFATVAAFILRQPIVLRDEVARRTRELKDSEMRFESLFEQAPMALSVTTDVDGFNATRWNTTWLETFGYDPALAQGKSGNQIGMWVNPEDRDRYIAGATAGHGVRNMEVKLRRVDGDERLVSVTGRFIESGNQRLLLTNYDDVTEARQKEQQIRELNSTLESRVEKRTKDLKKSNAELWKAVTSLERAQKDLVHSEKMAALGALVAGIAHELNTPIGTAVTVSTSLTERLNDVNQEMKNGIRRSTLESFFTDLDTGLDILFRNLHRAAELISSFKQVAVDQASQVRRPFELDVTVNEIVTTLRPSFKRLPITVKVDIPAGMQFDSYPGPLGQVVVNLINNAILHAFDADRQGFISITAERLQAPDSDEMNPWIRLTVRDNGKGIPDDHLPRIFDPFFTTKLGAGGSGLGLNISYNIVTSLLGGRIQAISAPGEGTQMVIELPMIAPSTE